jgi:hypothetical protein
VLQLFNDEDAGAFAHDEAIAVEGTGTTRRRFDEARRKSPGCGKAAKAHEVDASF